MSPFKQKHFLNLAILNCRRSPGAAISKLNSNPLITKATSSHCEFNTNVDRIRIRLITNTQRFCTFTNQLTDVEYERRSEETLVTLSDYLDTLPDRVDTDPAYDVSYSMGVITLYIGPKYGTYVINKQSPNKQIWLSSPISGPKRYDLSDSGRWVYRHDGENLHELLQRELRQIYQQQRDQILLTNLP